MVKFIYQDVLPIGKDYTKYDLITSDYISLSSFNGRKILEIEYKGLSFLSEKAFFDVSHFLRAGHLQLLRKIIEDEKSSENDKYVALQFLKNAIISSECEFPMCQDTGTAIVIGKKGQSIWTEFCDEEAISFGIYEAYRKANLRYSQNAPLSMYEEVNTANNLPAQIDLHAVQGNEYNFLFIAKGGGSANKTFLFQENKALLNPEAFINFILSKMKEIGTSACPPYHLVIVVGGLSAEYNLKIVKLASTGFLDNIPTTGNKLGHGFRDIFIENLLLEKSKKFGIGAQFGGIYFCHDIRVIRLPRHGASCPIGIGVSCSAHRNIKGKITKEGIYLEKLEKNPSNFLPKSVHVDVNYVSIDLSKSMNDIIKNLSQYSVSTMLKLTGKIIVARDIAHSKIMKKFNKGEKIPDYFKNHVIYYAGPAKTPDGYASGSFGPTTAGRMDTYIPKFQEVGASLVTLAKGNRSKEVVDSCKKNGGFYLGSIGGPAARLGRDFIKSVKVIDYSNLGMEAIFVIEVENFPAFILIDDKGNDFFSNLI